MIKTIDEAAAILNAHEYRRASNWNVVMRNTGHRVVEGGANIAFTELEVLAIARSLAGDYEALASQVQRLTAALKYPRYGDTGQLLFKLAEHIDERSNDGWKSLITPHARQAAAEIASALAETEEENISGDNGESVQS